MISISPTFSTKKNETSRPPNRTASFEVLAATMLRPAPLDGRDSPLGGFGRITQMIDQTAVALDHLVYRRWICTGPDHLDARHFRMSTERQIDPLKRIVNGCGDRVPQGLEVVQGVIRIAHC
jgi:hypothetical protein